MIGIKLLKPVICALLCLSLKQVGAQILAPEDIPFTGEIGLVKNKANQLAVIQLINQGTDYSTYSLSVKVNQTWTRFPLLHLAPQQSGSKIEFRDIDFFKDRIYICGNFKWYDGVLNKYNCIVYFDKSTSPGKWKAEYEFTVSGSAPPLVNAVSASNQYLFFGGSFQKVNGVEFSNIGRVNSANSFAVERILLNKINGTNGPINGLETDSTKNYLYLGGLFNTLVGRYVHGFAVMNAVDTTKFAYPLSSSYIVVHKLEVVNKKILLVASPDSLRNTRYLYVNSTNLQKITGIDSVIGVNSFFALNNTFFACGSMRITGENISQGIYAFSEITNAIGVYRKFQKFSFAENYGGDVYVAGNFYSVVSSTSEPFTLARIVTDFQRFYGLVFADLNSDGHFNSGDIRLSGRSVQLVVKESSSKSSFLIPLEKNGIFNFVLPVKKLATYTLTVEDISGELAVNNPYTFTGDTFNERIVEMPVQFKKSSFNDVKVNMTAATGWKVRNDTNEMYILTISNRGLVAATLPKLNLNFDNTADFNIQTNPPHNLTNAGSISWTNQSLAVGETKSFMVLLSVPQSNYQTGTSVKFTAATPGFVDDNVQNNIDSLSQTVTQGIAPFAKLQNPDPNPGDSFAWLNPNVGKVDYTIRFTNIDADTVNTVVVKDTINTPDYVTYIQETGSSHNFTRQVYTTPSLPNKVIVVYTFTGIKLHPNPSGNSEITASTGFIGFRVGFSSTAIPSGTSLRNRASIYLDNDAPVMTNTVVAKIATSGVYTFTTKGPKVYPNPIQDRIFLSTAADGATIKLYAMDSRLLGAVDIKGNQADLVNLNIPAGTIFYTIEKQGVTIGSGILLKN